MTELEPFSEELREQLGSPPPSFRPAPLKRARAALPRPTVFALSLAALGGGAGASLAALWLVSRAEPPADLQVAALVQQVTPEESQWLDSAVMTEPYRLPDGSTVALAPKTLGRLATRPGRVRFELARGSAKLNLAPRSAQTWTVVVGVYQVEDVAGASFVVERTFDDFALQVEKGKASVRTASRPELIPLGEGQRFEATPHGYSVERSVASPFAFESVAEAAPPSAAISELASGVAPEGERSARVGDARAAEFLALCRRGKYPEALAAAKRAGFAQLTRELSAVPLGQLADAARLGGDPDSALLALRTLEHRFPRSAEARSAPFLLGRVYAGRHENALAIAAFERYLAQGARMTYGNEALGRLMELYSGKGEPQRAAELARRYLASAPNGPYRRLALSLIDGR